MLRPANYIGPGQSETFAAASFAGQIARIERGLARRFWRSATSPQGATSSMCRT